MERYSVEDIKEMREWVIKMRNEALKASDFDQSVRLSHLTAMLYQLLSDEDALATRCTTFVPPFTPFDTEARD